MKVWIYTTLKAPVGSPPPHPEFELLAVAEDISGVISTSYGGGGGFFRKSQQWFHLFAKQEINWSLIFAAPQRCRSRPRRPVTALPGGRSARWADISLITYLAWDVSPAIRPTAHVVVKYQICVCEDALWNAVSMCIRITWKVSCSMDG